MLRPRDMFLALADSIPWVAKLEILGSCAAMESEVGSR